MAQVKFLKAIPFSAGWKEMEATDDLTLNSFAGSGADITNLNMSNASSGTLNKAFYDPTMAGDGLGFSNGVLNVALKSLSGLVSESAGVAVNYDGTTLGISGGKLAVLPSYATKSFSTINFETGDDVVALSSSDTVNFLAGSGMSFVTDATTRTITFVATGGGGGGTYTAGTGLIQDPLYKFNLDYDHSNYWRNTQYVGGFTGTKLFVIGVAADADDAILGVSDETSTTTFGVDRLGHVTSNMLTVNSSVVLGSSVASTINTQGVFISSILPSVSNLRTLGDATHRWEDIFVDDLMGDAKTVAVNNLVDKTATESISGTWSFTSHVNIGDTTADTLTILSVIDSNMVPDVNNSRTLGDVTHRWEDIFVDDIVDTNGASYATTRLAAIPDSGVTKPTASASVRGLIYVTNGGIGVADVAEICLKSSTDTYSWVQLAVG